MPVVTAATVIGTAVAPEWVPVLVTPPLLDTHVAVWLVIALPLFAPFTNVIVNEPVAVVVEVEAAFTELGAAGAPTMIGLLAADCAPVPVGFLAAILNV